MKSKASVFYALAGILAVALFTFFYHTTPVHTAFVAAASTATGGAAGAAASAIDTTNESGAAVGGAIGAVAGAAIGESIGSSVAASAAEMAGAAVGAAATTPPEEKNASKDVKPTPKDHAPKPQGDN